MVKEECLEDNEGKTAMNNAREVQKVKKRKVRSRVCWDSDRGF